MTPQGNIATQPATLTTVPAGVTSPIFWASFFGILVASIISGLDYLDIIGEVPIAVGDPAHAVEPKPLVVIFCCLLCVRYYASMVFLSYEDVSSGLVRNLEKKARLTVFVAQLMLVIGCSLNIAILPVFGGAAASAVIIFQAVSVAPYWTFLGKTLVTAPDGNFRLLLALGDLAILGSAIFFFLWEIGWATYNPTGAGFCMGAIFIVFVAECTTTYRKAIKDFLQSTIADLK